MLRGQVPTNHEPLTTGFCLDTKRRTRTMRVVPEAEAVFDAVLRVPNRVEAASRHLLFFWNLFANGGLRPGKAAGFFCMFGKWVFWLCRLYALPKMCDTSPFKERITPDYEFLPLPADCLMFACES